MPPTLGLSRSNQQTDQPHTGYGITMLTKRLEAIQRQAAISITGTLRSSPGDATIAHAGITPLVIQLKEVGLKTFARLATRPANYPISHSSPKPPKKHGTHSTTLPGGPK